MFETFNLTDYLQNMRHLKVNFIFYNGYLIEANFDNG